MDNIKIRKMDLKDLKVIENNLEEDFDDFWTSSVLENELKLENSKYLVAILNDEIVGFAGVKITLDEADIMNIVTKKDRRNNGIASALLHELIEICKEAQLASIFLEVNENNTPAISLYEKFGFDKISIRKNYYQGDNAIIMKIAI